MDKRDGGDLDDDTRFVVREETIMLPTKPKSLLAPCIARFPEQKEKHQKPKKNHKEAL